ncbi:hypothetical protein N9D26_00185 [bacterium]|nr:hypothetical protein [bacterium]
MKLLFTSVLFFSTFIVFSQEDYFQKTDDGELFWQKSFSGSKEQALDAIYTNLTIRNNVITEIKDKLFFDFQSDFIFKPESILSGYVTLRAKIRVEFKPNKYRVTILKMQEVSNEFTFDILAYSVNSKKRFQKIKTTLNRELPKIFKNLSAKNYNTPW